MTYKLIVTETNNKAGKYHYQVVDEENNLISERRSNREYVACTTDGEFYFGRLDLIGKGDHGRLLRYYQSVGETVTNSRGETFPTNKTIKLARLTNIAYAEPNK